MNEEIKGSRFSDMNYPQSDFAVVKRSETTEDNYL